MSRRLSPHWLPRTLWGLTLSTATTLVGLVVLSPLVAGKVLPRTGAERVLQLFARDPLVRRTALASALGLAVTASVFFRPPRPQIGPQAPRAGRTPPPVVGA